MADETTAGVFDTTDRGEWTSSILRRAATKVGGDGRGTAVGLTPRQRLDLRVAAVEERERALHQEEQALEDRVADLEGTVTGLKTATRTMCGLLAESAELLIQLLKGDPRAPARAAAYLEYLQERSIEVGVTI